VRKEDADEDEWTVVNKTPDVTSSTIEDEIQVNQRDYSPIMEA